MEEEPDCCLEEEEEEEEEEEPDCGCVMEGSQFISSKLTGMIECGSTGAISIYPSRYLVSTLLSV